MPWSPQRGYQPFSECKPSALASLLPAACLSLAMPRGFLGTPYSGYSGPGRVLKMTTHRVGLLHLSARKELCRCGCCGGEKCKS
jgi:hypothetical protein